MNSLTESGGKEIGFSGDYANLAEGNSVVQALPPTDSGKDAYRVLAGCFLAEVFTWGKMITLLPVLAFCTLLTLSPALPYSYGVFQAFYTQHGTFASQTRGVAAVGSTFVGLMMGLSPIPAIASQRWPHLRRISMAAGLLLASSSLVAASFCTRVEALIATQGVLYAIGCVFAYFPCFIFLDEW